MFPRKQLLLIRYTILSLIFTVISFAILSFLVKPSNLFAQSQQKLGTITVATANLRTGPGKTYAVSGKATQGQTILITSQSTDNAWYQLTDGKWVAASLVNIIPTTEAVVTEIVDGDTIGVSVNGQAFRLRYIGINTPETDQPYGSEATEANRQLVSGQTVLLEKDVNETDRYSRLLRYIYLRDGRMVNEVLVLQGFAQAATYPPDVKYQRRFASAQQRAQVAKSGLWASQAVVQQPQTSVQQANQPASQAIQAIAAPPIQSPPTPTPIPAPVQPAPVQPVTQPVRILSVDKYEEYVTIRNDSGVSVNLAGWRLLSERGNQDCPLNGELAAGVTLQIWAASGSGFSCNFDKNIWNNKEDDDAVLYNASGSEVSRYDS